MDVSNKNFLSPLGFRFSVDRLPSVSYFCKAASIPALSTNAIETPNPFKKSPYAATQLEFGELELTFYIDEDLKNFDEIFGWLKGLTFPEKFDEYSNLSPNGKVNDVFSDATLMILTNQNNPNFAVKFSDIFPLNLSTLQFDSTAQDVEYLEATVSFSYKDYLIEKVS